MQTKHDSHDGDFLHQITVATHPVNPTEQFAYDAVVQEYRYSAFGEVLDQTGIGVLNPFLFTAREWEPEVGLHYYRARFYDPVAGRFLSQDPMGYGALEHNLYKYAGNSPTIYADPSGMVSKYCGYLYTEILRKANALLSDLRRYNPVLDAFGGHPITKGGKVIGKTKPGGHFQEIQERQRGLKGSLGRYVKECLSDNDDCDGDGPNTPPPPAIPRWIDQMANRPVEPPPEVKLRFDMPNPPQMTPEQAGALTSAWMATLMLFLAAIAL